MAKTKKDRDTQNSRTMLDQKTGSMLDKKTNEDFNNEHPDHNEAGLINDSPTPDDKNIETNAQQTVDKKNLETKLKKRKQ
ncbi:MAG TPA: hypothetical protein VIL78_05645 [Hanamia sp.]